MAAAAEEESLGLSRDPQAPKPTGKNQSAQAEDRPKGRALSESNFSNNNVSSSSSSTKKARLASQLSSVVISKQQLGATGSSFVTGVSSLPSSLPHALLPGQAAAVAAAQQPPQQQQQQEEEEALQQEQPEGSKAGRCAVLRRRDEYDALAEALADALRDNCTLTSLNLETNVSRGTSCFTCLGARLSLILVPSEAPPLPGPLPISRRRRPPPPSLLLSASCSFSSFSSSSTLTACSLLLCPPTSVPPPLSPSS